MAAGLTERVLSIKELLEAAKKAGMDKKTDGRIWTAQGLLCLAGALAGGVGGLTCGIVAIRLYKFVFDFPLGADRRAPLLITIGAIAFSSTLAGVTVGVVLALRMWKRWRE